MKSMINLTLLFCLSISQSLFSESILDEYEDEVKKTYQIDCMDDANVNDQVPKIHFYEYIAEIHNKRLLIYRTYPLEKPKLISSNYKLVERKDKLFAFSLVDDASNNWVLVFDYQKGRIQTKKNGKKLKEKNVGLGILDLINEPCKFYIGVKKRGSCKTPSTKNNK